MISQDGVSAAGGSGRADGSAIELPGSTVDSVTYGAGTMTVVTNLGTTTFSDVSYESGGKPEGFVAAADPKTGLEEITFTAAGYRRGTHPYAARRIADRGAASGWRSAHRKRREPGRSMARIAAN